MTDVRSKFRIAVIGIGGVGGYVGGKLAAHFRESETVEVVLLARGENEKAIRARGLKLVSTQGEQVVRPKLITTGEINGADLIVLCTKEYDLEQSVSAFKDFIGRHTVILPLLNGVDTAQRIARVLPGAEIWQGCIYIVSRLTAPGVVEESGNICLIYFGDGRAKSEKSEMVENVFRQAGIDAHFALDITVRLWEKFVFISALAAATSYLNATIGAILSDQEHKNLLGELVAEIKQVAAARRIDVAENAIEEKFGKLKNLPFEATSSMHTDFSKGRPAELESLVGYVVRQAKELNVPTPVYDKIYRALAEKQKAKTGA